MALDKLTELKMVADEQARKTGKKYCICKVKKCMDLYLWEKRKGEVLYVVPDN
jgi:hypothetical protein